MGADVYYIERIKALESENQRLMLSHGNLVREANRKCEFYSNCVETLREECVRWKKEIEELKRVCYFLDDDRQQTKRLCQEWRDFGQYASSAMKKEIDEYREKLFELEQKQQDLLNENRELKKSYTDIRPVRNVTDSNRDFADASSDTESARMSKSNADDLGREEPADRTVGTRGTAVNMSDSKPSHTSGRIFDGHRDRDQATFNNSKRPSQDDLLDYIRGLEIRVQQLEQDRLTVSVSAPNLTAFHSPPSEHGRHQGSPQSKSGSNRSSLCDEICILVEESLDEKDAASDEESLVLSPIVEESECDRNSDSSDVEEEKFQNVWRRSASSSSTELNPITSVP